MTNDPIAVKEETKYFTPRELHRIPVSEYDWNRLKDMSSQGAGTQNWASFVASLSLGVFVSGLYNLLQLSYLKPKEGYPTTIWVVAFVLVAVSAVAAVFAHLIEKNNQTAQAKSMSDIHAELVRIDETFEPYSESKSSGAAASATWNVAGAALQMADALGAAARIPSAKTTSSSSAGAKARIEPKPTVAASQGRNQTVRDAIPTQMVNNPAAKPATDDKFKVGDAVEHKAFGRGAVVAVSGDALTIRFDNGETKRLLVGYAPIRRADTDKPSPV